MYNVLKSYLSDRYLQIISLRELINLFPVKSGLPHGSVLGPMLYTMYTADLPTNNMTTLIFADDIAA